MKKFLLVICITILAFSCNSCNRKNPTAIKGILDLRGWDFEKDGIVQLKGEWEFYWNKFYYFDDFHSALPPALSEYMKVPGFWDEQGINGKKLPPVGFATYRLIILTDYKQNNFGIWFKNDFVTSAITLYYKKNKILSLGVHGKDINSYYPAIFLSTLTEFNSDSQKIELLIYVSNQWKYNTKGGIKYNHFEFGPLEIVKHNKEIVDIIHLLIFGSLLMTGLTFLGFFMLRKNEKSSLYFSLYCIFFTICFFILAGFSERFFGALHNYNYYNITYCIVVITWLPSAIFYLLFFYNLYPQEYSKKFLIFQLSISAITFISFFIFNIDFWNNFAQLFRLMQFLSQFYIVYIIIKAIQNKRIGAVTMLVGFAIYFITSISDFLYHTGIYTELGSNMVYSVYILALTQALVLSKRFSLAYTTVEAQTIELIKHKEHLEELVIARTSELKKERDKSEKLLLNVLPKPIAVRLKEGDITIADHHNEASVAFIDIVDFTKLSANAEPEDMVNLLNNIFTTFDKISSVYGLEKIKTIGDCYMVASGIPIARKDHAEAIAQMVIDSMNAMEGLKTSEGKDILFRIGLDSGPIVAGVIGEQKFSYDLWGDIVNTASRMEKHGITGKIQCTDRFKNNIILYNEKWGAKFEERGEIEIKGKGKMMTWFLNY